MEKPRPKKTSWVTWAATATFAIVVVSCINGNSERDKEREIANQQRAAVEAAKSPEQKASEAAIVTKKARDFLFSVEAAKLAKASLKNPDSFVLVTAGLINNGALCLVYRATNSFNAIVTENIAIRRNMTKGVWNRDCAGRSGADMSHIKHAM